MQRRMEAGFAGHGRADMIQYPHQHTARRTPLMTLETAARLTQLRKERGLSQEELAEKLHVSRQAVSK